MVQLKGIVTSCVHQEYIKKDLLCSLFVSLIFSCLVTLMQQAILMINHISKSCYNFCLVVCLYPLILKPSTCEHFRVLRDQSESKTDELLVAICLSLCALKDDFWQSGYVIATYLQQKWMPVYFINEVVGLQVTRRPYFMQTLNRWPYFMLNVLDNCQPSHMHIASHIHTATFFKT